MLVSDDSATLDDVGREGRAMRAPDVFASDVIPARDRPVADLAAMVDRPDRVLFMLEMMSEGWLTAEDRKRCASAWGVTENCVSRYASEAMMLRRLDPSRVERAEAKRTEYVLHLERLARKAEEAGEYRASSDAIDKAADIGDVKAPAKHEVSGRLEVADATNPGWQLFFEAVMKWKPWPTTAQEFEARAQRLFAELRGTPVVVEALPALEAAAEDAPPEPDDA